MFLPWFYDASQLAVSAVYLVTYFCGVGFWNEKQPLLGGMTLALVLAISTVSGVVWGIPFS